MRTEDRDAIIICNSETFTFSNKGSLDDPNATLTLKLRPEFKNRHEHIIPYARRIYGMFIFMGGTRGVVHYDDWADWAASDIYFSHVNGLQKRDVVNQFVQKKYPVPESVPAELEEHFSKLFEKAQSVFELEAAHLNSFTDDEWQTELVRISLAEAKRVTERRAMLFKRISEQTGN